MSDHNTGCGSMQLPKITGQTRKQLFWIIFVSKEKETNDYWNLTLFNKEVPAAISFCTYFNSLEFRTFGFMDLRQYSFL